MAFKPYISRSRRIYNYWHALTRWAIKEHPAEFMFMGTFGILGFARFFYLYSQSNGTTGCKFFNNFRNNYRIWSVSKK